MFAPFVGIVETPALALAPALAFAAVAAWNRRKSAIIAAGAWALYCLYELGVAARILCSGDCAIRADLLLIVPLLLGLSLWALIAAVAGGRAQRSE